MIADLIINIFVTVSDWLLSFLPTATLPSGLTNALSATGSSLYFVNYFLDGEQLLIILGLVLTIEITINTLRIMTWLYQRVRG